MNKSKNNKLLIKRKKYSKIGGLYRILPNLDVGHDLSLLNFYKFLQSSTYDDLTMIIGIDYMYLPDTNRMIEQKNHVDFGWTYNTNHRHNPSKKDNWYQINDLFSEILPIFKSENNLLKKQFNIRDKFIQKGKNFFFIEKQKIYNKLAKIIFDSSTTKFLDNTIFINYVYYFLLNVNGELYFEPNFLNGKNGFYSDTIKINDTIIITIDRVNDIRHKINTLQLNEYGNNYYIQKYTNTDVKQLNPVNYNIVIDNNKEYFKKHLFESDVQVINNLSTQISIDDSKGNKINYWQNNSYPIELTNYSIGSYYKITKMRNLDMNDLSDISNIINSNDESKFVYF